MKEMEEEEGFWEIKEKTINLTNQVAHGPPKWKRRRISDSS